MKRITTAQYKEGIQSLRIFSDMLGEALQEVMSGVKLERESAYGWRGYQIEKFPGLKERQYYCHIYLGNPNILNFFQYYDMVNYPFKAEFDLATHGFFFLSSYTAQKRMLMDFIGKAATEALAWEKAPAMEKTDAEKTSAAEQSEPLVLADMLDGVFAQAELLDYILKIAKGLAGEILGRDVIVRYNFWGAWDYRSVLMTFDLNSDDKRAGFHPYGWFLHYDRPEVLTFEHKPKSSDGWNVRDRCDLAKKFYFTQDDAEKQKLLESFVRENLTAIKEQSRQY